MKARIVLFCFVEYGYNGGSLYILIWMGVKLGVSCMNGGGEPKYNGGGFTNPNTMEGIP